LYVSMMNVAMMAENRPLWDSTVRVCDEVEIPLGLTNKIIEFVSLLKLSMNFLSLISASDTYRFQYVADVSPYLATLKITLPDQRE